MKIYTRLLAGFTAAGLGLSAVISANAAGTAASASPVTVAVGTEPAVQSSALYADDQTKSELLSRAIREMLSCGNYREGEAIAVVRGTEQPAVSGTGELLLQLGAGSVKDAIETEKKNGSLSAELAQQRMTKEEGDGFSIWQVSDPERTTGELLQELYADSDVISAEPNYLAYAAEETEGTGAEEQETSSEEQDSAVEDAAVGTSADTEHAPTEEPAQPQQEEPALSDLSAMQWELADTSDIYTTPLSPTGGYSLGVPGWKEGHRNENAPANASGTICIMDTGIDTGHPDLQGVLYEFTPEQQAKYGCGKYGYNASGDQRPLTEQKAVDSHGTHVAGIIAANWDGKGVSGIAHGVKIFSVNVFGGAGSEQDMKYVLKGFRFLIDAAQEVNLKAVNCSWGTAQPQFALSTVIEELGRKGVNTVIASGNRYLDLDESIDLGSQSRSPYAIVVGASSADGTMTDFSCWGQDSVDVFAPGGSILSSVPEAVQIESGGDVYSYSNNVRFYPEVSEEESLLSGIERFDSDTAGVLFFDANPALDPEAHQIGTISDKCGFDDRRSMALPLSSLPKEEQKPHGGFSAINGYAYMAIPVTSAQDARWISVKTAMSDAFKPSGGIDSITCSDKEGNPVEIDSACVSALKKGWGSSAFYTIYQCQWSVLSYNIQGYIEASNEAHELLGQDMTQEERNELNYTGFADYRDPGMIEGIYEWENGEQKYVIARIGIGMVTGDARQTEVTGQTNLYVDNVAVGSDKAFAGSYAIFSGTSMAAPEVTGCLGVIAAQEPESSTLTEQQLEEEARERAAKLMASVDYDDGLSSLCRTGGRVNLHEKTEFTVKAPLISKASAQEDGNLTVEGWYFGTAGTVAVDDKEIEAITWEDGRIQVNLSGIPNGSHVVRVTNADGAVSRAVFTTSSETAEGRRLFEKTHSLPLREQAFIDNECDRIYDSIAACGGKIYAFAVSAKYRIPQSLWSYDIEQDRWSPCSWPEGFHIDASSSANQLAVLKDRLYLHGTLIKQSESGERTTEEYCLWRYEPYGDFWEKLDVEMPSGSIGICALGDTLYAVGGEYWTTEEESGEEDEDAASDAATEPDGEAVSGEDAVPGEDAEPDGDAGSGDDAAQNTCLKFYKIDLSGGKGKEIKSDIDASYDGMYSKIEPSTDKLYIFLQYGLETDPSSIKDMTTKGKLLRVSYDAVNDKFVSEDLSDALETALGPDLRTEYDKQNAGDEPAEHFAIAGLKDGLAIIGSGTLGEDVHIIYNDSNEAVLYEKTSSYHKAFDPLAVYYNGELYVIGYNTIEPEVMYFRSDPVKDKTQAPVSPEETAGRSRYMGFVTIGLIAGVVVVLAVGKRRKE